MIYGLKNLEDDGCLLIKLVSFLLNSNFWVTGRLVLHHIRVQRKQFRIPTRVYLHVPWEK